MEGFRNFSSLPPEIRSMIWAYSLPDPRVYEIMDVPHAKQKMAAAEGLMFANVHHEPPPPLAGVCRESRCYVLWHYRPLTLGRTTKFVDLARDMLLLEPYLLLKRLHRTLHFMARIPLIRDHLAALALGTSYGVYTGICHPVLGWKAAASNIGKLLSALASFPRLKTLLFVVHQEFQFEFDCCRGGAPGLSSLSSLSSPSGMPGAASPPQQRSLALPSASHPMPPLPSAYAQPVVSLHPQVVHQAYRFKFDIETNINRHARRPHLNELLFYPLKDHPSDDDRDDDWEALLSSPAPGAGAGAGAGGGFGFLDDADDAEWCDPWPTNDDWRRFKRRFQRAVVTALQMGLAGAASEVCPETGSADDRRLKCTGSGQSHSSCCRRRRPLRHSLPAVRGASLLWRYTRG